MANPKCPQNLVILGTTLLAMACSGGSGSSSLSSPSGSPQQLNSFGTENVSESLSEVGMNSLPEGPVFGPSDTPPDTVFDPSLISANMISSSPIGSTPILGGGGGGASTGLGLAVVTGLPGAVNMSLPIARVCVTNLTNTVSDSCAIPNADGSFQSSISADSGDQLNVWAVFNSGSESDPILVIVASTMGSTLPRGEILAFAESEARSLFVATYEGIYYFNPFQTDMMRKFQPTLSSPTPGEQLPSPPIRVNAVNGLSVSPVRAMIPAEEDCVWAQHDYFALFTKVCGISGATVTLHEVQAVDCSACDWKNPKSDGFGGLWATSPGFITHLRLNETGGFDTTNYSVSELMGGPFVRVRVVGPLGSDHAIFVIGEQFTKKMRSNGSTIVIENFPFNQALPLEFYQASWASDGRGGLLGLRGVYSVGSGSSGGPTDQSIIRSNTRTASADSFASTVQVVLADDGSAQIETAELSLAGTSNLSVISGSDLGDEPQTRDFDGKHWFLIEGVGLVSVGADSQGNPANAVMVVDQAPGAYGYILRFERASTDDTDRGALAIWVATRQEGMALAWIDPETNTFNAANPSYPIYPIARNANASFAHVTALLSDDTVSAERLWIGAGSGIWCSTLQDGQEFAKQFPTNQSVESIYRDGPNHLLVGTSNGFLDGEIVGEACSESTDVNWRTVAGTQSSQMFLASIPYTYVRGFSSASGHPDGRGGVWVATGSNIGRFIRDTSGNLQQDFLNRCFPTVPLSEPPVPDGTVDAESGDLILDGSATPHGGGACISGTRIYGLTSSPNGDLWVSSDLGLDRFRFQSDGSTVVDRILTSDVYQYPKILGLSSDALWVTSGSRVVRISDVASLTPQIESRHFDLWIYSPFFLTGAVDSSRNGLWLGTSGKGVMYLPINGWNTATPTSFTADNGYLPSDQVSAIDTAANGRVYFGTYEAGVARFN